MVHTPPDEQTCLLIAHWFFEMLDMTVSLNDGRCIWAHATECLEKRQQIGPPCAPMEARLYGLRILINASSPSVMEKPIEGPDVATTTKKAACPAPNNVTTIEVDDVVFTSAGRRRRLH
jgi:hypothetical protein